VLAIGRTYDWTFGRAVDAEPDRRRDLGHAVTSRSPGTGTCKTCASLLAALDVHPRVAMRILRHSTIAVTMEIYTEDHNRPLSWVGDTGIEPVTSSV
jgi:hypothetical protein